VDIAGVTEAVSQLFRSGKAGYSGHHPTRLHERRFDVEIRAPETLAFRGVVSFGLGRDLALEDAVHARATPEATLVREGQIVPGDSTSSRPQEAGSRANLDGRAATGTAGRRRRWWPRPSSVQAFASVAQLLAALVLVGVTYWYATLTSKMLKAQIEPAIGMELIPGETTLAIGNDGVDPVVDVSLDVDTFIFLPGSSTRPPVRVLGVTGPKRMPGGPTRGLWNVERLSPGAPQTVSIQDPANNAIQGLKMMEKSQARGEISGVLPQEKVQLRALLLFRLIYHREVDKRRYTVVKRVAVMADPTGKVHAWDTELLPSFLQGAPASVQGGS
jgi:hypothetical protein